MNKKKKHYIFLDFSKAKRENLFVDRIEWLKSAQLPEMADKSTYIDLALGAKMIINIDGFCIFDKDIEKLISSFADRVHFFQNQNYSLLKWK